MFLSLITDRRHEECLPYRVVDGIKWDAGSIPLQVLLSLNFCHVSQKPIFQHDWHPDNLLWKSREEGQGTVVFCEDITWAPHQRVSEILGVSTLSLTPGGNGGCKGGKSLGWPKPPSLSGNRLWSYCCPQEHFSFQPSSWTRHTWSLGGLASTRSWRCPSPHPVPFLSSARVAGKQTQAGHHHVTLLGPS